jgi:hypothetical protein
LLPRSRGCPCRWGWCARCEQKTALHLLSIHAFPIECAHGNVAECR